MKFIESGASSYWRRTMARFDDRDIYQSYDYHAISGGQSTLVFLEHDYGEMAWPMQVRSDVVEGERYIDVGSVYGYPGPVAQGEWPDRSVATAWQLITEWCHGKGIISVMSRLNPLIAPVRHLRLIGDVRTVGTTVGIETRIPESEQWRQYRDNHQRGIKKLRKLGVTCAVEPWHESLEVFLGLYHETMKRVCADDSYYFNRGYFSGLCSATDFNARIYVCRYLGLPIAAGLFLFGSRFGHYHLGGTGGEFLHLAPTKLMFDTVRRDCATEGVEVFHLGGGIGGADDSLFKFKAGFSNTQYEYRVFSGVVDEFAYKSLVALRLRQAATVGKKLKQDYFPLYRAPLVDNTSGRT